MEEISAWEPGPRAPPAIYPPKAPKSGAHLIIIKAR